MLRPACRRSSTPARNPARQGLGERTLRRHHANNAVIPTGPAAMVLVVAGLTVTRLRASGRAAATCCWWLTRLGAVTGTRRALL